MSEIEETLLDSQPITKIHSVGAGRRHANKTNFVLRLGCNIVHSRDNYLKNGTSVATQEMYFVNNNKADLSDITSRLPATGNTIPLFRCGDNDISIPYSTGVRCIITRKLNKFKPHLFRQSRTPVFNTLSHESLHRCDVYNLGSRSFTEGPPHCQL